MIKRVKLIDYGLFKKSPKVNFIEKNYKSPTGYFIRTDDIILLKKASEIKIDIGKVIGIKYYLECSLDNEFVNFQCKIIHPKLINPKNGISFTETIENKYDYANRINFDFYEFEEEWELVSGRWKFQIFENNKLLLNKEFYLVPCEQPHFQTIVNVQKKVFYTQ